MKPVFAPLFRTLLLMLLAGHGLKTVQAGNTWDGGGGNNLWSNSLNWSFDTLPGYGTLVFDGALQTTNVIDSVVNMNQVNWNGAMPWVLNSTGPGHLMLYDNGGTQAKLENYGSVGVTINAPITFAATAGANFGEINAVSGSMNFTGGTLTVNGSAVNGIKLFGGGGNDVSFANTVDASGKWFGFTSTNSQSVTIASGANVTTGDWYVMNGGTLKLAGGTLTTSAVRLGGDFGTTGNQNQTLGGTLALTAPTGGISFGGTINTVGGNTSNALLISSQNATGTNTLTGGIFLDSDLKIQQMPGAALTTSTGTFDVKAQKLTVEAGAMSTVTISQALTSSLAAGGSLVKEGNGTLVLSSTSNNYTGTSTGSLNANGTQIFAGTLAIAGDGSLGLVPSSAYNNVQFTGSGTLRADATMTLSANRNISVASSQTATFDSNGNTLRINGVINGSGNIAVTGAGNVTLAANNTYSGGTNVSIGSTLRIGAGGSTGSLGGGSVVNDGEVIFNRTASYTLSNAMSGTGALTKQNSNTLFITGTKSYIGNTTISAGTLSLGNPSVNGMTEIITYSDGALSPSSSIVNNATLRFARQTANQGTHFGLISGTGDLRVEYGAVRLDASNSFSGKISIIPGSGIGNNPSITFNSIGDVGGGPSALGAPATVSNGTIDLGTTSQATAKTSSLIYYGGGHTSDRVLNLSSQDDDVKLSHIGSGLLKFTSDLTATGAGSKLFELNASAAATGELAGAIPNNSVSNVTSVSKTGSGTWILSGTNTYTGPTTVSQGVLQIGSGGTSGSISPSSNISISTGARLAFNRSDTVTQGTHFETSLSGGGALRQDGSGTLVLTGTNTYSGGTTINAGTLQIGNGGTTGTLGSGSITNNAMLAVNRSDTVTFTTDITGTGGFEQMGTGTTVFVGSKSYEGNTLISGGTLQLGNGASFGAAGIGSITNNGALVLDNDTSAMFSQTVSGSGMLTKNGSGSLQILGGLNTFAGLTTIAEGTLEVMTTNAMGSTAAGTVVQSGATLWLKNHYNAAEPLTLNGTGDGGAGALRTSSGYNVSYAGPITAATDATISVTDSLTLTGGLVQDGGNFRINGGGTLNINTTGISGSSPYPGFLIEGTTVNLNAASTLDGIISVTNGGTLNANVAGAFPASPRAYVALDNNNLNGASTLVLGASQSLSYLEGAISSTVDLGSYTLTLGSGDPPGGPVSMSGTITGTGNLVKDGTNWQKIEGVSNTYTGTTTIAGGTLLIFGDESLGAVPGAPENKLFFTGNGTLWSDAGSFSLHANRGISISSGVTGTLSNGGNTFTINGAISGDGNLASAGSGMTVLNGSNTYSGTTTVNAGVLSIGSGSTSGTLGAGDVVIGSGAELRFNRSNAYEVSIAISGAGDLRQSGSGTATLSGGNSYSGTTFVSGGTLEVQVNNALGTTAGGTQVASGATLRLDNVNYATAESLSLSGLLQSAGSSVWAGGIQVSGGGAGIDVGDSSGDSLTVNGSLSLVGDANLSVQGTGEITLAGGLSGASSSGQISLQSGAKTVHLSGSSSFAGTIIASSAHTIRLGMNEVFAGPELPVIGFIGGGHLDLAGYSVTLNSLYGVGYTVGNSAAGENAVITFAGAPRTLTNVSSVSDGAGTVGITRAAGGELQMSFNSYSGLTTAQSGGWIEAESNNALGSALGGTVVESGGALALGSAFFPNVNYTTAEPLTINGNGISGSGALYANGTSSFAGPITAATDATIKSGGTLTLTGGLVKDGTTLTLAGSGIFNINTTGISGSSPNSDLIVDGATVNLNAGNTYNGPTFVQNGGTLNANVIGAMPTSPRSAVHLDPGLSSGSTLALGASQEVEFVSGAISSSINLGSHTLTVGGNAPSNAPFAGVISGSGGIVKDGSNGWTLTGTNNTYSGSTTLAGGTLGIYGDGSLGLAPPTPETTLFFTGNATLQDASNHVFLDPNRGISIASGVTATFDANGNTFTVGGAISGSGHLSTQGNVTLTGTNSYIGDTGILTGVLSVGDGGSAGTLGSGDVLIEAGAELRINRDNAITVINDISGAGGVRQAGSGTTTLGGLNTYAGGTVVSAGVLRVQSDNALGSTLGGTTVDGTAALLLDNVTYSAAEALQLSGTLSNSGTSSFAGAITNNLGLISAGGGSLTLSGGIDLAGSQLQFHGGGTVNITGNGISSSAPDVGFLIDGTTLVLAAASSFEGPVFVDNGGILRLGAANVLPSSPTVELHLPDGDFDLNGFSTTVSALAGTDFSIITNSGAGAGVTLVVNGGAAFSFAGVIQDGLGTVSLERDGTGTTVLEGASTYSGTTSINSGSIQLSGSGRLGSAAGGTTVASGAALELQGVNYTAAEALTINGTGISGSGALFSSGTSSFAGQITAATDATIKSAGTLTLTGGLVKDGTTLTLAGSGTIHINNTGISGSSPNSDLIVDGATVVLNTASSYNGPTTVQNSGTLKLGISNAMPTTPYSALSLVTGGTFDLNGNSDTIASLSGTGTVTNGVPATGSLTLGSNGSGSFSGAITGDISLNKTGSGIQTLSGASTYGTAAVAITTITQGTLNLTNTSGSATGESGVVLNPTGTLAGTGSIQPGAGKSVYLNGTFVVGDATLGSPVASEFAITTTGGGTMNVGSTATLEFDLFTGAGLGSNNAIPTAADILTLQGDATFATGSILEIGNPNAMSGWLVGDSWRIWDTTGAGALSGVLAVVGPNLGGAGFWDFNMASGVLSIVAVPEASRSLLLLLASLGFGLRRRR
ncbi:MAG: autotransporter-associated beta strand repeat-containing protein [Verrucomicrobiaceae bacterium]|nr:autotransporter-associated beta strand repeat-containing protein [Verrucomicrobiaceae bacterium]